MRVNAISSVVLSSVALVALACSQHAAPTATSRTAGPVVAAPTGAPQASPAATRTGPLTPGTALTTRDGLQLTLVGIIDPSGPPDQAHPRSPGLLWARFHLRARDVRTSGGAQSGPDAHSFAARTADGRVFPAVSVGASFPPRADVLPGTMLPDGDVWVQVPNDQPVTELRYTDPADPEPLRWLDAQPGPSPSP